MPRAFSSLLLSHPSPTSPSTPCFLFEVFFVIRKCLLPLHSVHATHLEISKCYFELFACLLARVLPCLFCLPEESSYPPPEFPFAPKLVKFLKKALDAGWLPLPWLVMVTSKTPTLEWPFSSCLAGNKGQEHFQSLGKFILTTSHIGGVVPGSQGIAWGLH